MSAALGNRPSSGGGVARLCGCRTLNFGPCRIAAARIAGARFAVELTNFPQNCEIGLGSWVAGCPMPGCWLDGAEAIHLAARDLKSSGELMQLDVGCDRFLKVMCC